MLRLPVAQTDVRASRLALLQLRLRRVSAAQQFVGLLYPEDFKDSSDFETWRVDGPWSG